MKTACWFLLRVAWMKAEGSQAWGLRAAGAGPAQPVAAFGLFPRGPKPEFSGARSAHLPWPAAAQRVASFLGRMLCVDWWAQYGRMRANNWGIRNLPSERCRKPDSTATTDLGIAKWRDCGIVLLSLCKLELFLAGVLIGGRGQSNCFVCWHQQHNTNTDFNPNPSFP